MDLSRLKYDIYKAKDWFIKTGMDHIRDGLFAEGGELIYEAKYGEGCSSINDFHITLKRICWWSDDMIDESLEEIFR